MTLRPAARLVLSRRAAPLGKPGLPGRRCAVLWSSSGSEQCRGAVDAHPRGPAGQPDLLVRLFKPLTLSDHEVVTEC